MSQNLPNPLLNQRRMNLRKDPKGHESGPDIGGNGVSHHPGAEEGPGLHHKRIVLSPLKLKNVATTVLSISSVLVYFGFCSVRRISNVSVEVYVIVNKAR